MNESRKRIVIRKTKPTLSKEHRAAFTLIIIVGCLSLILGGLYVVRHIAEPFFIEYSGEYYFTQDQENALEMIEQQTKDTDSDGITDYDELYLHGSSPYLSDTDGDGYGDATEIAAGTDVNCAAGQDCSGTTEVPETDLFGDIIPDATDVSSGSVTSLTDIQDAIRDLTASEIRDLLVTAGADQEMVDAIPDEDLQTLLLEVMSDLEGSDDFQTF